MKITKQRLKQIIKEELETVMSEKKQTIGDNYPAFLRIINQIDGMTSDRAEELLDRVRHMPMSSLASAVRMYINHDERAQVEHELVPLYQKYNR
jgi:hypothetical protein